MYAILSDPEFHAVPLECFVTLVSGCCSATMHMLNSDYVISMNRSTKNLIIYVINEQVLYTSESLN